MAPNGPFVRDRVRASIRRMKALLKIAILSASLLPGAVSIAHAGEADVVGAEARQSGDGSWTFSVTVRHADKGWNHYADAWEVLDTERTVLATRILAHPHVNEQPFTRSKSGIKIPATVTRVIVRARDSVHGYGGAEMTVTLER